MHLHLEQMMQQKRLQCTYTVCKATKANEVDVLFGLITMPQLYSCFDIRT